MKNYSKNKWLMNEYEVCAYIGDYMKTASKIIEDYRLQCNAEDFIKAANEEIDSVMNYIKDIRNELELMKLKSTEDGYCDCDCENISEGKSDEEE